MSTFSRVVYRVAGRSRWPAQAISVFMRHGCRTGRCPSPRAQSTASAAPAASQAAEPSPRALLDQYCVTCHNERLKTGGLSLDNVDVGHPERGARGVGEGGAQAAHRRHAADRHGRGRSRLCLEGLASYLETELDKAAAAVPNAGRVAPHRLNRTEYTNAVRDLLGLEIPVSLLPDRELDRRLRQHRRRVDGVADAARALHDAGAAGQPACRRRLHDDGGAGALRHRRHAQAARSGERRPSVRRARCHAPPFVPARRRVHRAAPLETDTERIHPRPRPSCRSLSTSASMARG